MLSPDIEHLIKKMIYHMYHYEKYKYSLNKIKNKNDIIQINTSITYKDKLYKLLHILLYILPYTFGGLSIRYCLALYLGFNMCDWSEPTLILIKILNRYFIMIDHGVGYASQLTNFVTS